VVNNNNFYVFSKRALLAAIPFLFCQLAQCATQQGGFVIFLTKFSRQLHHPLWHVASAGARGNPPRRCPTYLNESAVHSRTCHAELWSGQNGPCPLSRPPSRVVNQRIVLSGLPVPCHVGRSPFSDSSSRLRWFCVSRGLLHWFDLVEVAYLTNRATLLVTSFHARNAQFVARHSITIYNAALQPEPHGFLL